jgi:hypothetical protein
MIFLWFSIVLVISNSLIPLFRVLFSLSLWEQGGFWIGYLLFVGMAFLNVRFWYRRTIVFQRVSLNFWRNGLVFLSILSVLLSLWSLYGSHNRSSAYAGDPPVYLVSIRHWNDADLKNMPLLRSEMKTCDQYIQAVSPHTEDIPAYAALLSGMHPLKIPLWNNEMRPSKKLVTMERLFAKERYSTAAFVSDPRAQIFGQRFHIYDSPHASFVQGLHELSLFRFFPQDFFGVRTSEETLSHAFSYAKEKGEQAFFSWIQLNRDSDLSKFDRVVYNFMSSIRTLHPNARIALVGVQGREFGVSHDDITVPMLFCTPKTEGRILKGLVRTMDVMNTLLARVPISIRKEADGTDLFALRDGSPFSGFNTIVLSREAESITSNRALAIFAVTQKQKEIYKYIYAKDKEKEKLYFLTEDMEETKNIRPEKSHIANQVRQQAESVLQMIDKEISK